MILFETRSTGMTIPHSGSREKQRALATVSAGALLIAAVAAVPMQVRASEAEAQPQNAPVTQIEEVVVTGTRIIRDGYEAPTPLTVVGIDQIQAAAPANIADFVNTLPSFMPTTSPGTNTGVSDGSAGLNVLNLRSLGTVRTLVLLDGQRSVGSQATGEVDINDFPQGLVNRVDVVTGGASAAYGSDALSGVVNFVLDKKYTGIKGEIQGGVTSYGDDRNWKVSLTGGTAFANGRGHFLITGEAGHIDGVAGNYRPWATQGWRIITNPNYTAAGGQPELLLLPKTSFSAATFGGIIEATQLAGIAFGPGGVPYQFNYGSINNGTYMAGGDWRSNDASVVGTALDPRQTRQSAFTRFSYAVTDDIELFAQASWGYSHADSVRATQFDFGILVKADNPFIPASVASRMTALGIAAFPIGSMDQDLPLISTDNTRTVQRYVVGGNGKADAFGSTWTWDAYYQRGYSRVSKRFVDKINARFALATDPVRNPATGAIVCRSTLTSPNNGCVPYNIMGIGVNSQAAINYSIGTSYTYVYFSQDVAAATVRGEPFSNWAGPVSLATGIEHRVEAGGGQADAISAVNGYYVGNEAPVLGSYDVTEGFVETVVPLAKDTVWAKALDLNAAVRATSYSTSGFVATWKVGATYSPIDDIRFRATRSRDIRAPNRRELFASATFIARPITDPFRNNASATTATLITGNPALKPEDADTTGLGVVLQPAFIPGFSTSLDYYNIDISGAIGSLDSQEIVNRCFAGQQIFCGALSRNAAGELTTVKSSPFNFLSQTARGLDFEATYRIRLDAIVPDSTGDVTLRALATRYLKSYASNGVNPPTDAVGTNDFLAQAPLAVPRWRFTGSVAYSNDPMSFTLTGRGVSAGVYDTRYVQCTSGCPASSVDHRTINDNHIDGALYFDAAMSYKFGHKDTTGVDLEAFLTVTNLFDKDPPVVGANQVFGIAWVVPGNNPVLYDSLGRVFRAGIRFKM
ncbi:MAG: TonB-dependent receptor plug domain-containing protein [Rhodospirillaceae bacterium]